MGETLAVPSAVPSDVKRVAVERYKDGSGWFAYAPRNGRIGTVYASAETLGEVLNWAHGIGIEPTVIEGQ